MRKKPAHLLLTSALLLTVLCSLQCRKSVNELDKLPPLTQEGKGTFGCLVNGKAWVPEGNEGAYPNFRIIVDPTSLDIRVYTYKNQVMSEILIGCTDFSGVGVYDFNNPTKQSLGYLENNCQILRNDTAFRYGSLKITRFDSEIISGTFECILFRPNCRDTIRFTNGRFDAKL